MSDYTRKVLAFGTSLAVTLPVEYTRTIGLRAGATVDMEIDSATGILFLRPSDPDSEAARIAQAVAALEGLSSQAVAQVMEKFRTGEE